MNTLTPLALRLAEIRSEGRAALIGYLPAGFPSVEGSIAAMKAMIKGGVDAIEVGFPYSDPVMDGPTIQLAADRALANGTRASDVLRIVSEISKTGTPVVVMTYWNPVLRYGVPDFARDLVSAGGSGLITPDLTIDEGGEWLSAAQAHSLDPIFVVAPSTNDERLTKVTAACRGFVYAASTMGVTGARASVSSSAEMLVRRVRATTELPVCVGLGVSTADQANEVARYADGVIVGSAFVRALLDAPDLATGLTAVEELARSLAKGVRR
ncbi:MAG TPA: tryptophan synthase subunit alpha [Candidatus Nanopelagicaceae bacterium]|nr:tryptophan synthase subunit alpha [Candidatus Nanopelagicaceae bacterium]